MERTQESRKDSQEGIDNSVLVVGLYNRDPCNPIANFFNINFPSGRTEDMGALKIHLEGGGE